MFDPIYRYNISAEHQTKTVNHCDIQDWYCDKELVSVINKMGKSELMTFSGEISLRNVLKLVDIYQGYRTIFHNATSYQKLEAMDKWEQIPETSFLLCFVLRNTCYAVTEEGVPHFINKPDPHYYLMKSILKGQDKLIPKKGTVISLDAFREKRR
jgi:hypothetical protein